MAILDRVDSDHHAVCLDVMFVSIKFKSKGVTRGTTDWPKILSDKNLQIVYNTHLQAMTAPHMEYDEYNEIIKKAGELTATIHK